MKYSAFILLLFLFSGESIAIDKNGKFAVKGVGNTSCETFREAIENNESQKYLFAGWLNGYITGQNQHWPETFDVSSWETVETLSNYIYHYCGKNQKLSYFQASTQMLNELFDNRVKEFVGAEEVNVNGATVNVYKQVVVEVQKSLLELGLFKGPTDGKLSEDLYQAIMIFNKNNDIDSKSYFDQRTLHTLLRR